nr:hypothetical protein HmN_000448700 [Hymenolepis microstoma]
MAKAGPVAGTGKNKASKDDFVVPHMSISCITNSPAYLAVLCNPDLYLHNLHNLPFEAQGNVRQYCQQKLLEMQESATTVNDEGHDSTENQMCRVNGEQELVNSLRRDLLRDLREEIERKKNREKEEETPE